MLLSACSDVSDEVKPVEEIKSFNAPSGSEGAEFEGLEGPNEVEPDGTGGEVELK